MGCILLQHEYAPGVEDFLDQMTVSQLTVAQEEGLREIITLEELGEALRDMAGGSVLDQMVSRLNIIRQALLPCCLRFSRHYSRNAKLANSHPILEKQLSLCFLKRVKNLPSQGLTDCFPC
ncbi:hypothetical protein NDU88_003623 [Pleurodeles waltl]|uniref:Uncharacterized protein n=1 Tax=Pleurodeles waltl TaxID=8319 RepID=A0AAV7M5L9_PLEWA|nr:hypothetical protein NDU88_003623 [Pleurodeles waltl]